MEKQLILRLTKLVVVWRCKDEILNFAERGAVHWFVRDSEDDWNGGIVCLLGPTVVVEH